MTEDKAFYKSTDSSFAGRRRKYMSRASVCFSKNKVLSLLWWKSFNVSNLPPGSWLITLVNGAVPETQCQSVSTSRSVLNSGCSQAGLGKWKSHVAEPMYNSHLFQHNHFVHELLGNDKSTYRKRLTSKKQIILSTQLSKSFFSGVII